MKKIISVIISLIFYASILPWSYAEPFKHSLGAGSTVRGTDGTDYDFSDLFNSSSSYSRTIRPGDIITKGPWVDVRAFGTITYGLAASTAQRAANTVALQDAIDAAGEKELRFPVGIIAHNGLSVTKSVKWEGSGWDLYEGTVLAYFGDNVGISIINPSMTGFSIKNICLMGTSQTIGASDNIVAAMMVQSESTSILSNVYFWNTGGRGLWLVGNTSVLTIDHCRFQHNRLSAIYGRGSGSAQINSINITNNEIVQNYSHGIDTNGTLINIERNTIQGNDNAGVNLDTSDDASAGGFVSINIHNNYFEANSGGSIRGNTIVSHTVFALSVENNYSTLDNTDLNAGITAHFTFNGANTGDYYNSVLGVNFYGGDAPYWVDFNNIWDGKSTIYTGTYSGYTFTDKYANALNTGSGAQFQPKIIGPDISGEGSPSTSPEYIGQYYWDITNGVRYVSFGTSSSAYWGVLSCYSYSYASAVPTTQTPKCVGQMWYVTDTKKIYKSACMTDNTCWQLLN